MTILLVAITAALMFVIERLWPESKLPTVRNWWQRVVLFNAAQVGIVVLAGLTWDRWLHGAALIPSIGALPVWGQALVGYLTTTFIYYFWHRLRHESKWFWRLCHQLHHSPQRLEVFMSFYKHPVEIAINSLLSSAIVYLLLGLSVEAAAWVTAATGVAELFYHWNIRTPRWFGYLFQRPESHRVHHMRGAHTDNYSDIPLWDMLFGTFQNPHKNPAECGFEAAAEDRLEDMLAFRDVTEAPTTKQKPLQFLPTCIGCSKRWACHLSAEDSDSKPAADSARDIDAAA